MIHVQRLLVLWTCASAARAIRAVRGRSSDGRIISSGHGPTVDSELVQYCRGFLAQLRRPEEQVCKGPFGTLAMTESSEEMRRVAFVIRGESFRRNNGIYDRVVNITDATVNCQLEATVSQVNHLILPLEACGISVDVFISSWKPEGDDVETFMKMMVDKFQPRVVSEEWPDHSLGMADGVDGQAMNYDNAWRRVIAHYEETGEGYDGMFILRADLAFKRPLVNMEKADWNKLLYAFHEWEYGGGTAKLVPQRIPDTLLWFPWKYANCVKNVGWQEHNHMSPMAATIGLENVGFMMPDEFHNSSSASDRNPIYRMACREEQEYEIHGGVAYALFNAQEITDDAEATESGSAFVSSIFHQGEPQTIPPTNLVMHSWSGDSRVQKSLGIAYGQKPQRVLHETFTGSSDDSGWTHALVSMKKSYEMLVEATKGFLGGNPSFTYDHVAFVRLEHAFQSTPHLEIYDFDTSRTVYVWFGGAQCSAVPTLMLMSDAAAWKLGDYLVHHDLPGENLPLDHAGVAAWLERVIGLTVRIM